MADGSAVNSIIESARRLGTSLLSIVETRLALFSTDLQEAAHRFVWLFLWAVIGVFFFGLGVLLVALTIIALFWDTHRLAALGIGAGLFLAASLGIAALITHSARQQRNLFAATLGELAKDRDHLNGAP